MRKILLAAACAAVLAQGAGAQSQLEMNQNAWERYQAADVQLNQVYRTLTGRLSPRALGLLRTAQRAWISYRDAECRYQRSEAEGGTMSPMLYSLCLETLTRERTRHLQSQLQTRG